jgi:L-ascorbate metabolism protein UlaG (beta-lactamase superfamily)
VSYGAAPDSYWIIETTRLYGLWPSSATTSGAVVEIRFLGHSCFELVEGETRVLIDPFLTGNPKAAASADDVQPTHIFLTHGHQDHFGDTIDIAKRTSAQVVCVVEIGYELEAAGVENVLAPNLGGTVHFAAGWVRLVPAWHTSTTPGGTVNTPAGLVINLGGKTVYHLGDTALFSDLALVPERDHVDVALMCVGGFYTMDAHDAVAAAKLVKADTIIPCHYATFPGLLNDVSGFKADVEAATDSNVAILEPGETYEA